MRTIRHLENMIYAERLQEIALFSLEKIRQKRQITVLKYARGCYKGILLISMFTADRKNKQTSLNYTNDSGKSDLKKS